MCVLVPAEALPLGPGPLLFCGPFIFQELACPSHSAGGWEKSQHLELRRRVLFIWFANGIHNFLPWFPGQNSATWPHLGKAAAWLRRKQDLAKVYSVSFTRMNAVLKGRFSSTQSRWT